MAEIRVEHSFKCSEETFWTKVFFDDEYNRRLFQEILKFPVWRVAKSEERGDEVHRTIEASPPIGDLPAALKAVVGDSAGYEERGVFNKKTHRYRVQVVPNRMSDKISVVVEMWTEPTGDAQCKRFAKATATAGRTLSKAKTDIQALETARCIEEGVVTHAADADVGSLLAWGFPSWTGGPLSLIDTVGGATFVAECKRMAESYGARFAPSASRRAASISLRARTWSVTSKAMVTWP